MVYVLFPIPKLPEWLLSRNDFEKLIIGLKTSTAEPGVFTDEDFAEYKKAWSEPNALTSGLNYYRANIIKRLFSNEQNPEKIKVPTLFIYGEKDHAVLPQTIEGIRDLIDADYKEVRIPESGHWVQVEAREKVTNALRDFLSK